MKLSKHPRFAAGEGAYCGVRGAEQTVAETGELIQALYEISRCFLDQREDARSAENIAVAMYFVAAGAKTFSRPRMGWWAVGSF